MHAPAVMEPIVDRISAAPKNKLKIISTAITFHAMFQGNEVVISGRIPSILGYC